MPLTRMFLGPFRRLRRPFILLTLQLLVLLALLLVLLALPAECKLSLLAVERCLTRLLLVTTRDRREHRVQGH